MNGLLVFTAAASGYLLGSLSFARLVTKWAAPGRSLAELEVPISGTGQAARVGIFGANAASMILGPRLGVTIGVLDALKVMLPVWAFRAGFNDQPYFLIVAVAGLVGHNWPLYHRFEGGRGFSVILGSLLVVDWLAVVVVIPASLLLGVAVARNLAIAYVAWLWLMIPWLWFRTRSPAHLAYALAVNAIFWLATIPEIRTMWRLRREGKLDAYMQGLYESSPRWRGMKHLARFLGWRE